MYKTRPGTLHLKTPFRDTAMTDTLTYTTLHTFRTSSLSLIHPPGHPHFWAWWRLAKVCHIQQSSVPRWSRDLSQEQLGVVFKKRIPSNRFEMLWFMWCSLEAVFSSAEIHRHRLEWRSVPTFVRVVCLFYRCCYTHHSSWLLAPFCVTGTSSRISLLFDDKANSVSLKKQVWNRDIFLLNVFAEQSGHPREGARLWGLSSKWYGHDNGPTACPLPEKTWRCWCGSSSFTKGTFNVEMVDHSRPHNVSQAVLWFTMTASYTSK